MDPNSWTRLSTSNSSSRRYQSRSAADAFHLVEETDGDDPRPEYLCPFCAEDFDIVGLCCHIDEEHPVQAKNGVCPICAKKVGTGLVSHITMQHGSLLKVQRKRRLRRGGSNSTLSILKRELREGNLQSLLGASLTVPSSVNTDPDPLLSSFMYSSAVEPSQDHAHSSTAAMFSVAQGSNKDLSARGGEDELEKGRRSEFVQGLLVSTFLDGL